MKERSDCAPFPNDHEPDLRSAVGSLNMPIPTVPRPVRLCSSAASRAVLPSEKPASLAPPPRLAPPPLSAVVGLGERPRSGRRRQLPSVSFFVGYLDEVGHLKNCSSAYRLRSDVERIRQTYGLGDRAVLFYPQVILVPLLAPP